MVPPIDLGLPDARGNEPKDAREARSIGYPEQFGGAVIFMTAPAREHTATPDVTAIPLQPRYSALGATRAVTKKNQLF
jgi:hypothetical protein